MLEFGWEAYNQAVTPDIIRSLHATGDDIKQTKGYYCLNGHNCFESRYCFTSLSYDHLRNGLQVLHNNLELVYAISLFENVR